MSLTGPEPMSTNPLRRVAFELQTERRARGGYPPGDTSPSVRRTHRMIADPLHLLLEAYERHGPVFSLRILNARNVFMLGPEANHFMLVSHADRFRWRDGGFGDLIPLLGDGMLTIDGDFHKQSRRIMLPAFHHERVKAALGVMDEEIERALCAAGTTASSSTSTGGRASSRCASPCARCSASTPTRRGPARDFERALGFYGREYWLQVLRGPRTPWAQLQAVARAARPPDLRRDRRPPPQRAPRRGRAVAAARRPVQRPPHPRPRDDAAVRGPRHHHRDDRVPVLRARPPPRDRSVAGDPQLLEQALDETLRLYPPAWIGPRRAARAFEFGGHRVAEGAAVNYSSWASHRLPDVWEEPHAFRPERFAPEARKRIPKGAYVPFGGGSRICLGMRFGQARDPRDRDRRERALPRRVAARLPAPDPPDADARPERAADFRCESGCRFRSEEVVPEGEGGPRWQAASR